MILVESLLRKLSQLSLNARHVRAGRTVGERRSTKRGTSVEFADYRNYAKGDDLRRGDMHGGWRPRWGILHWRAAIG